MHSSSLLVGSLHVHFNHFMKSQRKALTYDILNTTKRQTCETRLTLAVILSNTICTSSPISARLWCTLVVVTITVGAIKTWMALTFVSIKFIITCPTILASNSYAVINIVFTSCTFKQNGSYSWHRETVTSTLVQTVLKLISTSNSSNWNKGNHNEDDVSLSDLN